MAGRGQADWLLRALGIIFEGARETENVAAGPSRIESAISSATTLPSLAQMASVVFGATQSSTVATTNTPTAQRKCGNPKCRK